VILIDLSGVRPSRRCQQKVRKNGQSSRGADSARVVHLSVRPMEGAGNAGCLQHPQPRAQRVGSTRVSHHRYPGTPGIPCAMVWTAYFVLSPATNSSCHRHRRMDDLAEPGWVRKTSADLTPATGARTTRLCRTRASICRLRVVDRSRGSTRPAITSRARRCRVHRIPSQRS
jgi:hypothetical protein